jgi:phosphohistidine swiveling domain-containing protein
LLQVRRLPPLPERVTWINSGPVELDRDRVSDLLDTARGGAAAMAEALGEGLRAAGLNATVHADEVRRFDGVAYLNVAAWRRVQAVALATRGARAAWRQIRLLLCPPAADEPDDGPGEPAPRSLIHAEARLLMALAFTRASMDRLRSDPAPLARWLRSHLERRWRRLAAARDRVRLDLTRAEAGLVGLCAEDDGAVQPPVAPTRRFEPELPTAPEPVAGLVAGAVLVGVPFSSGIVVGHLASRPEARVARPRVLVLPHGGPQFVDAALAGDAVVLASGGVLSHVAVDVLEAGLPGLVCTDPRLARLPDGTRVRVDANCGSLEILEVPT